MRPTVLRLYRNMLRQGKQYKDYNFREYILRRVRDQFRARRDLTDAEDIQHHLNKGRDTLELIQRQKMLDNMYNRGENIMEKIQCHP
eukprot:jgi/Bigna1/49904/estExt_Genewise1.C_600057